MYYRREYLLNVWEYLFKHRENWDFLKIRTKILFVYWKNFIKLRFGIKIPSSGKQHDNDHYNESNNENYNYNYNVENNELFDNNYIHNLDSNPNSYWNRDNRNDSNYQITW